MGQTHLRALRSVDDVAVTVVAEPVEALRQRVGDEFAIAGVASVGELLAHDIDGVLIVTPSDTHLRVITEVAASGKAVLCEKPCGVSVEEAREVATVASAAGIALQIAYWRRFVPELVTLKARLDAGEFGDVLALHCLQWDGAPPSSEFRAHSGGIFVDMGVHEFDQARWLLGPAFKTLIALAAPVASDPTVPNDPDAAQVLGQGAGAVTFVSLGRHYPGGDMVAVEVFGTKDHFYSVFLDPADGERVQLDALATQARAFADFARGGDRRGAGIDDAIAALEAAERASHLIPWMASA